MMQKAATASEESLLDTAVHEMLHALFFNDALMEDYIDDTGEALGAERVMGTDYAGRRIVKSPKAREPEWLGLAPQPSSSVSPLVVHFPSWPQHRLPAASS